MSQEKTIQVTSVEIKTPGKSELHGDSDLLAFARITINDQLRLTCRIVNGAVGPWVAYPYGDDGLSVFFPLTRIFRDHINEIVISKYNLSKEEVCK